MALDPRVPMIYSAFFSGSSSVQFKRPVKRDREDEAEQSKWPWKFNKLDGGWREAAMGFEQLSTFRRMNDVDTCGGVYAASGFKEINRLRESTIKLPRGFLSLPLCMQ